MSSVPIHAEASSVKRLLSNRQYSIDYYQREYKWGTKQITDLLNDLFYKFEQNYKEEHVLSDILDYESYFLGSIITSRKGSQDFLIDGQQRLTSLTLLLMFLKNVQINQQSNTLQNLIYSESVGLYTFNINVDKRFDIMTAIMNNQIKQFNMSEQKDESIKAIYQRYSDIENNFPVDLSNQKKITAFANWLIEKVQLIEITAYNDSEAYTIFETMNDRGLSLTSIDMLKGFVLAQISNLEQRKEATKIWVSTANRIKDTLGEKGEADFFRDWFRSKYSKKVSERSSKMIPPGWDRMANEIHRWFKEEHQEIGLKNSHDFYVFVTEDLQFYATLYLRIYQAQKQFTPGLEEICYAGIDDPYFFKPTLMSSITKTDNITTQNTKMLISSAFIDIALMQRFWAGKPLTEAIFRDTASRFINKFRNRTPEVLAKTSYDEITKWQTDTNTLNFNKNPASISNTKYLKKLLARITEFVEINADRNSLYYNIYNNVSKTKYEIEHILALPYTIHGNTFNDEKDIEQYRNQIGCLLLLEKSYNASINNSPYDQKITQYVQYNKLAGTLSPAFYKNSDKKFATNPGLNRLIETHPQLNFKPYTQFGKKEVEERTELYKQIANIIWSKNKILQLVNFDKYEDLNEYVEQYYLEEPDQKIDPDDDDYDADAADTTIAKITLKDLIAAKYVEAGQILVQTTKSSQQLQATLQKDGYILFHNTRYETLSAAASEAYRLDTGITQSRSGWRDWSIYNDKNQKVSLGEVRAKYAKDIKKK